MGKVNFDQRLVSYRGQLIPGGDGHPTTLRSVVLTALDAVLAEDKTATIEAKLKREDLAGRIWRRQADELPAEDVAAIKARLNATYPASLLVGAAVRAIESGGEDLSAGLDGDGNGKVLELAPPDRATDA